MACSERSPMACKGAGKTGNRWTNQNHPNYCSVETDQNTKKRPENLRRLAVTLEKSLVEFKITGRIETLQTIALLKSAKILWRVLETWGDLLSLKLLWKASRMFRKLSRRIIWYNHQRIGTETGRFGNEDYW